MWVAVVLFLAQSATLRDLNLYLVDTTSGVDTIVASSLSSVDNTENIWFELRQWS